MAQTQANPATGLLLDLSGPGTGPLHVRLTSALRTAIRSGRLPTGAALPPSRALAADLAVSRWTSDTMVGEAARTLAEVIRGSRR